MISFSTTEKKILLGYIEEMLDIFNDVLSEEFDEFEEPSIICNGEQFLKKDFEVLKLKIKKI